ncbi:hypothetical protein JYU34_015124 [Plutella xylostella]|uniref:Uncharacterized protein n=1 Tax=Plutella xylostella TaxID=51655 RepID=A0ABQ7Q6D1_PLUXY|nr:hypothetical protein JYU34_015124 [Plutella xylostella]
MKQSPRGYRFFRIVIVPAPQTLIKLVHGGPTSEPITENCKTKEVIKVRPSNSSIQRSSGGNFAERNTTTIWHCVGRSTDSTKWMDLDWTPAKNGKI